MRAGQSGGCVMKPFAFNSAFAADIGNLIRHKRSLGYKYETAAWTLRGFDEFCNRRYPGEHVLSRDLFRAWAERRPQEAVGTLRIRVAIIRQLALDMRRRGQDAYMLPSATLPRNERYTPYVFNRKDLDSLFAQVDACPYWPANPLRHREYPLLFRLLYCCGLRVSEACNLKVGHWHEDIGVLTICDGKYDRERQIPLAHNLAVRTGEYCRSVHRFSTPEDYLFPSNKGLHLSRNAVYGSFRQFLWQAGISHGGKGNGPRVHDLRHTFAVHCLKRWVEDGRDLNAYLPILKTYLGHTRLKHTAYYLRLTADLFPSVVAAVERVFPDLVPEIGECHENH